MSTMDREEQEAVIDDITLDKDAKVDNEVDDKIKRLSLGQPETKEQLQAAAEMRSPKQVSNNSNNSAISTRASSDSAGSDYISNSETSAVSNDSLSPPKADSSRPQITPGRRRTLNIALLPVSSQNRAPRRLSGAAMGGSPVSGAPASVGDRDSTLNTLYTPNFGPGGTPQAKSGQTPSTSPGQAAQSQWKTTPHSDVGDQVSNYMTQLAAKEARLVNLREQMRILQDEIAAAEEDVRQFQRSGKDLASLVNSHQSKSPLHRASTAELSHGAINRPISRSPSPRRFQRALNSNTPELSHGPRKSEDFVNRGRKMVEEVGTQFWSFVEDVRTAAMGDDRPVRDDAHLNQTPQPEKRSDHRFIPKAQKKSPERRIPDNIYYDL